MDQSDIAFLKGMVVFVLMAVTSLSTYWMRLRARQRIILTGDQVVDAMREENAQLGADLEARMAELEERVDFAERRLLQERHEARRPAAPTHTPV